MNADYKGNKIGTNKHQQSNYADKSLTSNYTDKYLSSKYPNFLNNAATKRLIIREFNSSNFLTAKNIHQSVTSKCNLDITYQGVHKHLQQLVKMEILSKQDELYTLSQTWINSMKKYSELISQQQAKNKGENTGELK